MKTSQDYHNITEYIQDEDMNKLFATYINFDLNTIADEDKIKNFLGSFSQIIEGIGGIDGEGLTDLSDLNFLTKKLDQLTNQDLQGVDLHNVDLFDSKQLLALKNLEDTYQDSNNMFLDSDIPNYDHVRTSNLLTIEDYLNQYSDENFDVYAELNGNKKHIEFKLDKQIYLSPENLTNKLEFIQNEDNRKRLVMNLILTLL